MNKKAISGILCGTALLVSGSLTACQSSGSQVSVQHQGDTLTIIKVSNPMKYLLLPIQEDKGEAFVKLETGKNTDTPMDMRLAVDAVDYYVPFELPQGVDTATIIVKKMAAGAMCWDSISVADTFSITNPDYYRPLYHHAPLYGWMNDPNGLIYKDGEYHLYFQFNPYGSKWGNMHWGHSVSSDMIHWEFMEPAIERDTLGHIFSGSAVIDTENSAGYGKDAMVAIYTSASDKIGQVQSLAYSIDNGRTYTKYEGNPILTPHDGKKDFRDPMIFKYEPNGKWYMIVSAYDEMRFYNSDDLKHWEYVSAFGKGYGAQPSMFECPDFFQLPVDGNENNMKWVMLVNINPGCMFGGSATQYFIGEFDGKEFKCDTKPEVTKWMDFGKDHYAAVCFNNMNGREVAIPWMSNWQYANDTPFKQNRGANGLPRELSLYTAPDGQIYLASDVIKEANSLKKDTQVTESIEVAGGYDIDEIIPGNDGAYQIEMDVVPGAADVVGFDLMNDNGEKVKIYFDMKAKKFVMDRAESGKIDFGQPNDTEEVKKTAINYVNNFALGTWAPISLCKGGKYHLNIFVDRSSVEIFVDEGRIAMTNLVFPTTPYDKMHFYTEGGDAKVENMQVSKLGL